MRFLLALCVSATLRVAAAATTVKPTISKSPPKGTYGLDRRVASFSIEFAYLPQFGGNSSNPNLLTERLISQITQRTGVPPDIRPGGISVDSSVYDPTLATDVQLVTSNVRFSACSLLSLTDTPVWGDLQNDFVSGPGLWHSAAYDVIAGHRTSKASKSLEMKRESFGRSTWETIP